MMPRSERPKEETIIRVGKLWDRCNELWGIGENLGGVAVDAVSRLAISGYYEDGWWGVRLSESVLGADADFDLGIVRDPLLALSEHDAELAFGIFEAYVVRSKTKRFGFLVLKKLSVPILARAFDLQDSEVTARALKCMDTLGSSGMVALDEEVEAFMGHPIAQ